MTLSSLFPQRRSLAYVALVFVVAALIYWNGRPQAEPVATQQLLRGPAMGTTYTIRYLPQAGCPTIQEMHGLVEKELARINQQMSTYLKDSEVSRFNASASTDWFPVSIETAQVVELAQQISIVSDGAFDITVAPLVNLWGFGPIKHDPEIPSEAELKAAQALVGYKNLEVRLDPPALKKSHPGLQIDLSAIAQGDGSDRVGQVIRSSGIANYFVEIGGEIVTLGNRVDGQPWQVGIEAPREFERSVQAVIGISGMAITTSGNYRSFFEVDGQQYSHTIDPSTGRPVTHALASATAVGNNCALADAVATCMMVVGPERGLELAESQGWAVVLMHRKDGRIVSTCSRRFAELFPEVYKQLSVSQ